VVISRVTKIASPELRLNYHRMPRLVRRLDGLMILYIGVEDWPFPVPIVPSRGRWHFDT
jgi:hypothetical protein